ncbi:hypothetical protein MASR1M8_14960 [Thermomonas brevis]
MTRKTRWLVGIGAFVLLALLLFVAAGPWLAMNGIRNVVASGDYGQLWRFVDFDQLRDSVRPQIQQRIARGVIGRIGPGGTSEAVGGVTALIAEPAIDAMVSPIGIATLLHGSALAKRAVGERDADGKVRLANPLDGAKTRYESPSLFTATVQNQDGQPVVFEFRRSGLAWKLAGMRLPE